MTIRYYQFAGINFALEMPEELVFEDERKLAPFRREKLEDPCHFRFMKVQELSPPRGGLLHCDAAMRVYADGSGSIRYLGRCDETWQDAYIRAEYTDKAVNVQLKRSAFPGRLNVTFVLESMAPEHLAARNDAVILHCSYIDHNGKAILFTAPSGTGKSTQADLWNRYRGADIINGDRAAVRLADGVLMAEGIPYAGSSAYCKNRSMPIEAVVYLGQAPSTTIRRLRGYEAFAKIWEGISINTWDREDLERGSAVVQKLAREIPVYHLLCTPDESAIRALETVLTP